eukprot:TRINITY_DN704_c0_g1_i5.p1 TRINITY_DN704_c0_g1~~TRINITY_DN704_c0_g1_i5.p1  ORF type:complete len:695 (-),score=272.56 TRINITY_DN704_c0_g1_i5:3-2087(-)
MHFMVNAMCQVDLDSRKLQSKWKQYSDDIHRIVASAVSSVKEKKLKRFEWNESEAQQVFQAERDILMKACFKAQNERMRSMSINRGEIRSPHMISSPSAPSKLQHGVHDGTTTTDQGVDTERDVDTDDPLQPERKEIELEEEPMAGGGPFEVSETIAGDVTDEEIPPSSPFTRRDDQGLSPITDRHFATWDQTEEVDQTALDVEDSNGTFDWTSPREERSSHADDDLTGSAFVVVQRRESSTGHGNIELFDDSVLEKKGEKWEHDETIETKSVLQPDSVATDIPVAKDGPSHGDVIVDEEVWEFLPPDEGKEDSSPGKVLEGTGTSREEREKTEKTEELEWVAFPDSIEEEIVEKEGNVEGGCPQPSDEEETVVQRMDDFADTHSSQFVTDKEKEVYVADWERRNISTVSNPKPSTSALHTLSVDHEDMIVTPSEECVMGGDTNEGDDEIEWIEGGEDTSDWEWEKTEADEAGSNSPSSLVTSTDNPVDTLSVHEVRSQEVIAPVQEDWLMNLLGAASEEMKQPHRTRSQAHADSVVVVDSDKEVEFGIRSSSHSQDSEVLVEAEEKKKIDIGGAQGDGGWTTTIEFGDDTSKPTLSVDQKDKKEEGKGEKEKDVSDDVGVDEDDEDDEDALDVLTSNFLRKQFPKPFGSAEEERKEIERLPQEIQSFYHRIIDASWLVDPVLEESLLRELQRK